MNRRHFMSKIGKICAVIPFVGSSSATGQSGASEGKPEGWKWVIASYNGSPNMNDAEIVRMPKQKFHKGDRVYIEDFITSPDQHHYHHRYATVLYSFTEVYGKYEDDDGYVPIEEYSLNIDGIGCDGRLYPEDWLIAADEKTKLTMDMIVDTYNKMGRPISPMAQLRRRLKKV